jgi:hypothetical protein
MSGRRTLRGLPVVGAAFGGVVLGHWVSYLLAMPSAGIRDEVLAATGHAYWLTAVKQAVVLAAVSLAAIAMREFRRVRAQDEHPESVGPGSLALRLAGLQVVGFLALELTERVAAGAPISSILAHHVLVLGLLVQVVLAASAALLLSVFARAAGALARALVRSPFPRPAHRTFPRLPATVLRPALVSGSAGPRSPPSP